MTEFTKPQYLFVTFFSLENLSNMVFIFYSFILFLMALACKYLNFNYPLKPFLLLITLKICFIFLYSSKIIQDEHDKTIADNEYINLCQQNRSVFTRYYFYFLNKDPPISIYIYNITLPNHEMMQKRHMLVWPIEQRHANTDILEFAFPQFISRNHYLKNNDKADAFLIPIEFHMYSKKHEIAGIENIIIPMINKIGNMYEKHGGVDHIFIQMLFCHHNFIFGKEHENSYSSMMTFPDLTWNLVKSEPREAQRFTICPYSSERSQIPFNQLTKTKKEYLFFLIGQKYTTGYDKTSAKVRPPLFNFLTKYFNDTKLMHHKVMSYFPLNLSLETLLHGNKHSYSDLLGNESMKSMVIETFRKGRKSKKYYNISDFMMKSVFCPVPYGDSPSSKRLFDTFKMLCIPIVFSDQIRFPFEDIFIDYSKFIIQVPMTVPENLGHVLIKYSRREDKLDEFRMYLSQLKDILSFDLKMKITNCDIMWAWLWSHFFKLALISCSKRRVLLESECI